MQRLLCVVCATAGLLMALVMASTAATVTLSWDYSLDDEARITGYRVEHSLDNRATWDQAVTAEASARTVAYDLTVTGVACWRMFAVAGEAASPPSNVVCHTFVTTPVLVNVTVTLSGTVQ